MKLRENCKYALAAPTSMGVRLVPENRQPFHTTRKFSMEITSVESNVLSVASFLGMPVKMLTAFVKGSPIARMIKDDLAGRHMDYEGPEIEQGGPWGHRHQINMADTGFGVRGPLVHNDRAGEVGRLLDVKDFDLERLFEEEGIQIIHLSGMIAAISPSSGKFCLELARAAAKHGTKISFDLNHRASFWKNREDELHGIFTEIAENSDILAGNEEDFQLCLGLKGPEAGGNSLGEKIESFKGMISEVRKKFPRAEVAATTLREVVNVNSHLWGALMSVRQEGSSETWHIIEPREIRVLDRIGGGDGFMGGLLYAILKNWNPEEWIRFGWASGAMVTSMLTDYAQPLNEDQIWSIWEGDARVKR